MGDCCQNGDLRVNFGRQSRLARYEDVNDAEPVVGGRASMKNNQARLQLFALAYNLANFLRRLAVLRGIRHWTLTTLREKLIKIGAKVTRHSKYVTFQLAEVAVPRDLFAVILERINRLAIPPPSVAGARV